MSHEFQAVASAFTLISPSHAMDTTTTTPTDGELTAFLARNKISSEDWTKANISWDVLRDIGANHDSRYDALSSSAEFMASVIQRFEAVHSVRWRVKNTDHLLEKIVRKRANSTGPGKYSDITAENYFTIVTDLVGVRALHLFKDEFLTIDAQVRQAWALSEDAIAYVREGDAADIVQKFEEAGFIVKQHPDKYRSVHYVCETQPMLRRVLTEIQVRTIFEEGWSEIDHRVRYPNFSKDQLVSYFLGIFNRLAGSADEMGTFVLGLKQALTDSQTSLALANREKEDALAAMEKTLSEIEAIKKQDAETTTKVAALQKEVEKLRRLSVSSSIGEPTTSSTYRTLGLLGSPAQAAIDEALRSYSSPADINKALGLKSVDELRSISDRFSAHHLGLLRTPKK